MTQKHIWDIVLFVDLNRSMQSRPLGAYRIASHLRDHGYRVKVLWAWQHIDDKIMDMLIRHHVSPDTKFVGISNTMMFSTNDSPVKFFGVSDDEFRKRLKLFREINPNIKIIVGGGSIPYADPEFLKSFKDVDYYVKGQGEAIIVDILDSVSQGRRPLSNDITKPPIISDTFYPFDDFSSSRNIFRPEDGILPGEPLPLEVARGCIFKCSYCNYDLLNKKPDDYTKTLDSLLAEFRSNHDQFGTTDYYIVDDIVNESDDKVDLLVRAAEAMPFPMHFSGYLRLDLVRQYPDRMRRLRDIGFYAGFFGVETVNDRSGRSVGKGLGIRRIREGLETIVDLYGDSFWATAGIIMGLPHDTPETKYQVLEWLNEPATSAVIKNLAAQPLGINTKFGHSEIDTNAAKFGYEILETPTKLDRLNGDAWRTQHYDSIAAAEDADWLYRAMVKSRPYSQKLDIWALSYLQWIDDKDDRSTFMRYACHNQGTETPEQWHARLKSLYEAKRKQYIAGMNKYR